MQRKSIVFICYTDFCHYNGDGLYDWRLDVEDITNLFICRATLPIVSPRCRRGRACVSQ